MINTPFNYTGSKYKLLDQILPHLDYSKQYFVDLFAGGGSVYTNIVTKYDKILINDIIKELVQIQMQLLKNDDIIEKTKLLCPNKEDKDAFLKLRTSFNENKSPEKLWALMLSSTNNMLRFNKSFGYNQTFGKRSWNPSTTKKVEAYTSHIRNYKEKLIFIPKHFNDIKITKPSMVYIDPPYLETEAGYNNYFSKEDGQLLYEYCKYLDNNGSSFMMSGVMGEHKNGKRSKLIDNLISDGYNYRILDHNYEKVARNKNTKNSKEVIITNY